MNRARECPSTSPTPGAGSVVRVDPARGDVAWNARITYVSGEILGLRGTPHAEALFSDREVVTLRIGRDDVALESQARVLAVGPRTLRVLATRGVGALERRRSVRVRVSQALWITELDTQLSEPRPAQLLDLSFSDCAIRTQQPLDVGSRIALTTTAGSAPLDLVGNVVRTWTTEATGWMHAGLQFDPAPPRTREMIKHFFVEHVRANERRAEAMRGLVRAG